MSQESNTKTIVAAVVVFIAVIAMFLGAYVFLLDNSEELTPEQIQAQQQEAESELDRLQNTFALAFENHRAVPELIEEIKVYASKHEDSVHAQLLYAQSQLYVRHYEEAYDAFEKALKLEPNQFETEMLVGTIAYEHLQRFDDAVEHFKHAAELRDTNPQPLLYMAQIRAQQGKDEEALTYLTEAVQIDRDLPQAHASLAELYQKREMYDAASREYELALEQSNNSKLQRQHAVYLFKYAQMLAAQGKPDEALVLLADIPVTARNQPEVLVEIGKVWNDLGEPDDAAKFFDQVVKADPKNEAAATLAVKYHIIAGDSVAATESLNTLRAINPSAPDLQELANQIADMSK